MTESLDNILDNLFHGCAFTAFVEQAIAGRGPHCAEKTRRRAYQFYEEARHRDGGHDQRSVSTSNSSNQPRSTTASFTASGLFE